MNRRKWDPILRTLHFLMAGGVFSQLLLSIFMAPPSPNATPNRFQQVSYTIHKWMGLFVFLVVLLHLFWVLRSKTYTLHLFPYTKKGWKKIKKDLKTLVKFKFPETGPKEGFAGLIHGLGFFTVFLMGLSGAMIFFFVKNFNSFFPTFHSFVSKFVWVYFIGHSLMAIFHRVAKKRW